MTDKCRTRRANNSQPAHVRRDGGMCTCVCAERNQYALKKISALRGGSRKKATTANVAERLIAACSGWKFCRLQFVCNDDSLHLPAANDDKIVAAKQGQQK